MKMTSLFAKMNPLNWFKSKHPSPVVEYKVGSKCEDDPRFTNIEVWIDGVLSHNVKTLLW